MSAKSARAKTIFLDALEIEAPDRRAEFLDEACAGDEALKRRVEALLAAHERPEQLLGQGDELRIGPTGVLRSPGATPLVEPPGTVIGPYTLGPVLGEGGMGVVYRAEQTVPVRRSVALKIIKPGMDSKQVIARFEVERQALALMDHPNIARVLDAGATASGRPYFVMELVEGLPITEHCTRGQLGLQERIELFVLVCRAVQHAHQKGIIHRDLKPSNVLVAHLDGVAVPKIIDFGIAKAMGAALTELTLHTGAAQLVGSPLYMSPEQAEPGRLDVDTRSDVYSLGVLLYELLTGTTPFGRERLRVAGYDELRRILREQDPPPPSARLVTLDATATTLLSDTIAGDGRAMARRLRGELDWIVLKCLEKDRTRRYDTANGLAADLMRFLSDRPIEAGPPSSWYRFRKYARRNRAVLTTAVLVTAALVTGTAASTWLAIRATRAEARTAVALAAARADKRLVERHLYSARLRQAQQALDKGQVERAQSILAQLRPGPGEPDLRGFGWHYLWGLARRELEVFSGLHNSVHDVVTSSDGSRLAASDAEGTILVWDTATGAVLTRITGLPGTPPQVCFSPDGRRIAAATPARTDPGHRWEIHVWDISGGLRTAHVDAIPASGIRSLGFSPSGRRLVAILSNDPVGPDRVELYDLRKAPLRTERIRSLDVRWVSGAHRDTLLVAVIEGRGLVSLDPETFAVRWEQPALGPGMSWSVFSRGGRFVTVEDGTRIAVMETATGRLVRTVRVPQLQNKNLPMEFVEASSDGSKLLIVHDTTRASVHDLAQGTSRLLSLDLGPEYGLQLDAIAMLPGDLFVAGSRHMSGAQAPLTIRDLSTGKVRATYPGRRLYTTRLLLAPEGRSLYLNGGAGVQRWCFDRPVDGPPEVLEGHADEAWSVAFSPRGDLLATGSDDTDEPHTIKLWDPRTGRLVRGWSGGPGTAAALAFSADGGTLASCHLDESGEVRLWDPLTGQLRATLPGHVGKVRTLAFQPGTGRLATGGDDCTIRIWDPHTRRLLKTLDGPSDKLRSLAFSPDGRTLASTSNDRVVRLWDATSWQARDGWDRHHDENPAVVGYSRSGRYLVVGEVSGAVTVLDFDRNEKLDTIHEDGEVLALAFAPGGRSLATAGAQGTIRIWDLETGQEQVVLEGHKAQVNALTFSPDGRTLVSCSHDGSVRLWTAERTPGAQSGSPAAPPVALAATR